MTARHDPHDALTADERALASLLDGSGPGPSADLDARILKAARAASAPPPTRSAAPASSVPPAAIDAERRRRHRRPGGVHWTRVGGIAASLVLVLGLGWRLALEAPMQRGAADATSDTGTAAAESVVAVDAPDAPQPITAGPTPQIVGKQTPDPQMDSAASAAAADASASAPASVGNTASKPSVMYDEMPPPPRAVAQAAPAAAPAPPAPPAVAIAGDRAAPAASPEAPRRARSASERADTGASAASEELSRIEVTGSRVRIGDVGISEDARLPLADWFDRIRRRRDDGDLDGARGSLARLRSQHPRVAVPDDLRALDVAPR